MREEEGRRRRKEGEGDKGGYVMILFFLLNE